MFYRSFGTQNSIVTFIFKFDQRKSQLQVKLGQIRSNFKIKNFLTKIYLYCAVLSQDSKNAIYFYVRQLKMPKKNISKIWRQHLYLLFCHCTTKNKDIALKFCMSVVCMYFDHIYSVILEELKILDFIGNYFLIIKTLNLGGQNRKKKSTTKCL